MHKSMKMLLNSLYSQSDFIITPNFCVLGICKASMSRERANDIKQILIHFANLPPFIKEDNFCDIFYLLLTKPLLTNDLLKKILFAPLETISFLKWTPTDKNVQNTVAELLALQVYSPPLNFFLPREKLGWTKVI